MLFISLASFAASIMLYRHMSTIERERPQLERKRLSIEANLARLKDNKRTDLNGDDYAEIRREIININSQLKSKGIAANHLLYIFEQKLPEKVRLIRLNYNLTDGDIGVVAESDSADYLYQFVKELESRAEFERVTFSQENTIGQTTQNAQQFTIQIGVRKWP